MKTRISKFITLNLIIAVLAVTPPFLLAQNQLVGELVITKNAPEDFVTVNGERVVSGRSVTSPSDISTSAGATAKLVLPQTGTVTLAPGSKMNLSFVPASIAGDFVAGAVTVETLPNTAINIFPWDGTVTTPNRGQANTVRISSENGKTRVDTIKGAVLFNVVLVSAGESYSPATNSRTTADQTADDSKGYNPLLIFGILGAVAGAVVIALSASSNSGDNPVVSPTR